MYCLLRQVGTDSPISSTHFGTHTLSYTPTCVATVTLIQYPHSVDRTSYILNNNEDNMLDVFHPQIRHQPRSIHFSATRAPRQDREDLFVLINLLHDLHVVNGTPEVVEVPINTSPNCHRHRHLNNGSNITAHYFHDSVNTTVRQLSIFIGANDNTNITIQQNPSSPTESVLVLRTATMYDHTENSYFDHGTIGTQTFWCPVTYRFPIHVKKSFSRVEVKEL